MGSINDRFAGMFRPLWSVRLGLQTDMTELPDGSILMAFNDDTVARTNLSLSRSINGGHNWTFLATLEDSPNGSFSYPTVTYMPDSVSDLLLVYHLALRTAPRLM